MPTLDDLDVLCSYLDDKNKTKGTFYHPPMPNKITHRALRRGRVIWIIKDGKPVEYFHRIGRADSPFDN